MDLSNIQPPSAAPSSQLDLSVQTNALQQQLSRLPIGIALAGTVVGNDKNGNLIIRLAGNDLILSSPLALDKGAQVALKIENVSGNFTATLLSIDGKLPATQAQAISNQLQQNPNALFKAIDDIAANLKILSVLNQGAAKPAPPQANAPQTSTAIKSDIVTLTSPQPASVKGIMITAAPEIVQSLKSAIALNDKKSSSSELAESLPEEVTAGSQLNLKITNVQTPPRNPQQSQVQTDNSVLAKTEEQVSESVKQNAAPISTSSTSTAKDPALASTKQSTITTQTAPGSQTQPGQVQPAKAETTQAKPTDAQPTNPSAIQELAKNIPPALQLPSAAKPETETESLNPAAEKTDSSQIATNLKTLVQNFSASFKALPNGNVMLNAMVIDTKPDGQLLVETRFGKMIIDAGEQFANTGKGSIIDLELTSIATPPATMKLPEHQLPLQQLAKTWPALKELADQVAPQLGLNTMLDKLAGIDSAFAGRMAAFMNAVKNGDLRSWLGANNYDTLNDSDTGNELLAKLKHDMGAMKDLMSERTQGSWQTMLFPVYDGRELQQARMHVKYLPDENNNPDKKSGTRFVVELDTSYFGEIQMDGLVHNNVASKYFDMIIRTHKPFDSEMENDIRQIFHDAGQVTGFKGDIEFASMREFPLKIMEDVINKKLQQQIDHRGIEA